jgi:hypothetical protein
MRSGSKPVRNPKYLAWIRTHSCVVCGASRAIEASHTSPHGLGQKSPDSSAIPLCARHHRTENDSYHKLGPRKFSQVHGLDILEIVRRLNRKPIIRVEAGLFVGYIDSEQYLLGNIGSGIALAVQKMIRLRMEHSSALS